MSGHSGTVFSPSVWKEELSKRAVRILTIVCVICASVLAVYMLASRFFHLTNGLQYDELYSAITASPDLSWGYIWKNMIMQDINLPLFNFLLFGWNRIFPFTQPWMHLFSALWSVATVLVAWPLAPAYWSRLKKGIFVSLVSGSFILSAYGAIVRAYSLAVFLTLVFSLLALRFVHGFSEGKEPSVWEWLSFFVVGLLGVYSHYFCTALFFITALLVFLYACYYKIGRAWSFFGTAVVFGLWCVWFFGVIGFGYFGTGGGASGWWYKMPVAKATYEVITFLFGEQRLFIATLYGLVIALVSFVSLHKKDLLKQSDMMLPLLQIVILLVVVAVISRKINLWMDRYFLPVMPSVILVFTECLDHLRKRHAVLLVLWPALLVGWVNSYWGLEHLHWPEYNGLHDAFTYINHVAKADTLYVDLTGTGYPWAAFPRMLNFYVPKDKPIEIIPLTKKTVAAATADTDPKPLVLMPLCSQVHLMYTAVDLQIQEDGEPLLFNRDTCLITIHKVPPAGERK